MSFHQNTLRAVCRFSLLAIVVTASAEVMAQNYPAPFQSEISDSGPFYFVRPLPPAIGFAFVGEEVTGGAGGQEVTVTTAAELLRFATSNEPYIINVLDSIEIVRGIGTYRESNGEYFLGSNTTLRGIGPNAIIMYGGFKIWEIENVIIQNLHFDGTYSGFVLALENTPCNQLPAGAHRYNHGPCLVVGEKGPSDVALDISEGSERIWVTQNTFRRYSDEILRVKREASYITLSWNKFDDPVTGKNGMMVLIGHSDNHTADIGRLKTTLHHNAFGSRDRQPRIRFGQVHLLNNYYYNPHGVFNYGAAAQRDSEVVIEGNYFDGVGGRPWRTDINAFPGYVDVRNNVLVNTFTPATRGTIGDEIFEPRDIYDYEVDDPADIPGIVMAGAGSGNWDYTIGERPVPGFSYTLYPGFSEVVEVNPVFRWTEAVLADTYQIQIAKSGVFTGPDDIVADTVVVSDGLVLPEDLEPETVYYWRVRAINEKGPGGWSQPAIFNTVTPSNIDVGSGFPVAFTLGRNYPNPFNPSTNMEYGLPESAVVDLRIYDTLGREVAVLVHGQQQQPGYYTVQFDAGRQGLASGLYIYRLVAQKTGPSGYQLFTETKSMLLVK